jgi:hypothetical protein
MKKHLALVLAGAAAMGTFGLHAAIADDTLRQTTPAGTVAILGGGSEYYEIWVDGASTNPDPLDGYVAVHSDGDVFCSFDGGPFLDDGTDNPDYIEPEEGGNLKCPV